MQQLRKIYAAPAWRVGIGLAVFVNSIVLGAITEAQEGSELASYLGMADTTLLSLLVLDVAWSQSATTGPAIGHSESRCASIVQQPHHAPGVVPEGRRFGQVIRSLVLA
jgi:hypothetical protein